MKKIAFLVWTIFCFSECKKNVETPSVPDEKTAAVMADLCLADGATVGLSGEKKDSLSQVYFDQVFAMHKITREEHERNVSIISRDLNRMDAVIAAADTILSKKQKVLKK